LPFHAAFAASTPLFAYAFADTRQRHGAAAAARQAQQLRAARRYAQACEEVRAWRAMRGA